MERITLNIIPKGITPICHASQFDIGRRIALDLMDGLQGYTLSDEEITLRVCKPDRNIVTAAVDVTPGKTYVIIETTEQMTAVEGDNACELKITKDGAEIGSLNFKMRVEQDPLKDGIESETVIHNLETQVADLVSEQYDSENVIFDSEPTAGHGVGFAVTSEGVKDAIDTAIGGLTIPEELDDLSDVTITSPSNGEILVYNNGVFENQANPASTANFAADYDDTATYNTNDKVIYQGLYYIALEDSITGAWDSTKWALTTVSALTAEELPLSGNDSTPTATAIGSLSSLTTTNQNSLVDAVNEVNGKVDNSTDYGGTSYRYIQLTNKMVVLFLNGVSVTTLNLIPTPARLQYFVVLNQSNAPTSIALKTDKTIQIYGTGTTSLYGTIIYQSA